MTGCASLPAQPPVCPSTDDLLPQVLALLPQGRAWQSREGGPRPGSVMYGYFRAIADVFAQASRRLCDLRLEFFCASRAETDDLWQAEYGLPDACDAFQDVCAKVAAIGGTRCEYFAEVALRSGWVISCTEGPATLTITVDMEASPAFVPATVPQPLYGHYVMGNPLGCDPASVEGLKCLLERIVHAHIAVTYVTA